MASKSRTVVGVSIASGLVIIALWLAALGAAGPLLGGQIANWANGLAWTGFGPLAVLPIGVLILITLAGYGLALFVSQQRLVLVQAIVNVIFGIAMILFGLMFLTTGLAAFVGMITLLFSFPFGTIVYFVEFGCGTPDAMQSSAKMLSDNCFSGVQLATVAALVLKVLALVVLLTASVRFAKVLGLWVAFGLGAGLLALVAGALWYLSDMAFLLYPLDALLSAIIGVFLILYGIVVFVISLFAVALAIAGQVG